MTMASWQKGLGDRKGLECSRPIMPFPAPIPSWFSILCFVCVCVFKLDQFPELDDRLISQLDGPAQEGLWCMEEAMWRESWTVRNHNCLKTCRNMNPQIRLVIACDVQLTDPMGESLPSSVVQGADTLSS